MLALTKQPVLEVIMADPILSPVKPCKKCGSVEKTQDGKRCKPCSVAYNIDYSEKHKAKILARSNKYYADNTEKVKRLNNDRYHKIGDVIKKARRIAYAGNQELKKSARERAKAWAKANPEHVAQRIVNWRKDNPDAVKLLYHNRREREKTGKLTKGIEKRLFSLQKGLCPCCKRDLGKNYHIDHIMPLALGGTNTDDNVQLLRANCNLVKNKTHPVDFMQSKGFLL